MNKKTIKQAEREAVGSVLDAITNRAIEGSEETCPICNRLIRVYKRRLHATMALFMVELYKAHEMGLSWVSVHDLPSYGSGRQRGDYAYLQHWDLIENMPNDDTNKRSSGHWRLTEMGKAFVERKLWVHSHCIILNGELLGLNGPYIWIDDALGKCFNYRELMDA